MYVRTEEGGKIYKILSVEEPKYNIGGAGIKYYGNLKDNNAKPHYTFYKDDTFETYNITKRQKVKSSHELMDLVEPMDLMYIDISPDDCGGIVVPRVAETLNELEKWKERISSGECILKGVLTKEQINNNCYWVGE